MRGGRVADSASPLKGTIVAPQFVTQPLHRVCEATRFITAILG